MGDPQLQVIPLVHPRTGEVVGGYTGYQPAPLVLFVVDPASATVVPLLVGTGSRSPELGYAVPAGEWAVQATLVLDHGRRPGWHRRGLALNSTGQRLLRTPLLPITIRA